MFGNPYTLFVLELCKHCGERSPSSSQVGTHPMTDVAGVGEVGRAVGAAEDDCASGRLLQLRGRERVRHRQQARRQELPQGTSYSRNRL